MGDIQWLDAIINLVCGQAGKVLPALNMFKEYRSNLT
jgi:hypothetical protein